MSSGWKRKTRNEGDVVSKPNPARVIMFAVCFDANGHGTAPGAVFVSDGECVGKPASLSSNRFLFIGWYRDAGATCAWVLIPIL